MCRKIKVVKFPLANVDEVAISAEVAGVVAVAEAGAEVIFPIARTPSREAVEPHQLTLKVVLR